MADFPQASLTPTGMAKVRQTDRQCKAWLGAADRAPPCRTAWLPLRTFTVGCTWPRSSTPQQAPARTDSGRHTDARVHGSAVTAEVRRTRGTCWAPWAAPSQEVPVAHHSACIARAPRPRASFPRLQGRSCRRSCTHSSGGRTVGSTTEMKAEDGGARRDGWKAGPCATTVLQGGRHCPGTGQALHPQVRPWPRRELRHTRPSQRHRYAGLAAVRKLPRCTDPPNAADPKVH